MGAAQNGDMVMWSSTETQAMAWAVAMDHLSDAEIQRLVGQKVLLPGSADRCTVPAEVARAAPQSMLSLIALGGESNLAQPKPAGAAASWKPEWTVKLRTKSTYAGLLGMDMAEMMGNRGGDENGQAQGDQQQPKKSKNPLKRGLKRVLGN